MTRRGCIIGTSPLLAIANASDTAEHVYYKYRFTNTSTGKNACFFYVTTATDCAAQTSPPALSPLLVAVTILGSRKKTFFFLFTL